MKKPPSITHLLRGIGLLTGLFALYVSYHVSFVDRADSTTSVIKEVQKYPATLLDEVSDDTEFLTLDLMLAGRSSHVPTSRIQRPPVRQETPLNQADRLQQNSVQVLEEPSISLRF